MGDMKQTARDTWPFPNEEGETKSDGGDLTKGALRET
jgi:hypothetical protein